MSCAICEKRPPKRFCPAKGEKICAICCGCAIVGRGSAYYLQNRPDAFHVFVYAPIDDKAGRLMASGKSEREAIQLAESVDRDRAAFIKQYLKVEWPDRHSFHMMVNSAISEDAAVGTILSTMEPYKKQRNRAPVQQSVAS
jgi:cytidylate kinase